MIIVGELYYQMVDDVLLWCVLPHNQSAILQEAHIGILGGDFAALLIAKKFLQDSLWWSLVFVDGQKYVQQCNICQ